jgi:hypothetical protein
VTSSATLYVINNGYDNLELKVSLPQDKEHAPLQVRAHPAPTSAAEGSNPC